jgi:hypothetical protein
MLNLKKEAPLKKLIKVAPIVKKTKLVKKKEDALSKKADFLHKKVIVIHPGQKIVIAVKNAAKKATKNAIKKNQSR